MAAAGSAPITKKTRRREELEDTMKRALSRVEGILRRWDPIGVRPGELAPIDEYDSYAPHIVSISRTALFT